jgi:cytochrome c oxidase assembly factor CtaG
VPAAPTPSAAFTAWTVQPLAIIAAVAFAGWYVAAVRRRSVRPGQQVVTAIGIAALVWITCGFAGVYRDDLYWVWTAQQLALLLVVPYLLLSGGALELAGRPVQRFLDTRFARLLANPLVGPALVPLLSVALFFGPLPRWTIAAPPFGWIEQLAVLAVGALVVLPLVGAGRPRTSLAVGLSLAIGSFELVLDALPGLVLRLHKTLATSYFDVRAVHSWSPAALRDQQIAGGVLWCVAELLDLPFLILVYRQWLRADANDAAEIDAVLEAERAARGDPSDDETRDAPWWLSDPAMQERLRRRS